MNNIIIPFLVGLAAGVLFMLAIIFIVIGLIRNSIEEKRYGD